MLRKGTGMLRVNAHSGHSTKGSRSGRMTSVNSAVYLRSATATYESHVSRTPLANQGGSLRPGDL